MKSKIAFGLISFILVVSLSASLSMAYCSMPYVYRENGGGLDLISGIKERRLIDIDQVNYSSVSWAQYNIQVKNRNTDQGMLFYIESETPQGNIVPSSVLLEPDEKGNMSVSVWVRQDKGAIFRVTGICDDGTRFDNFIKPELEFEVDSYESIAPSAVCSPPIAECNPDTGMFSTYYCNGTEVKSISRCVSSCCNAFGDQYGDPDAMCTSDNHACVSTVARSPTEGNISFVCYTDDCKYEKDVILALRLLGWDVDQKKYSAWTKEEFSNYDIIACYHQTACASAKFNSAAYNGHVTDGIGFLEIARSRNAGAGFSFGYVNKSSGSSGSAEFFATAQDELTDGYYNSFVDVTSKYRNSFAIFKDSYLDTSKNPGLVDLADSGNNTKGGSIFFKVNNTPAHGRYAFIGWMANYIKGENNYAGDAILNRTLRWLKLGDEQVHIGRLAFICISDACSDKDEIDIINLFRQWGYTVDGKAMKSWGSEINNYDAIVCRSSRSSCKVAVNSTIYLAHMQNNVPFLEIPETTKAYAAEAFGYKDIGSYMRSASNYTIQAVGQSELTSGLGDFIGMFTIRRPSLGADATSLNLAQDIAHMTNKDYSTLFIHNSSTRYAFVGWLSRGNIKYATSAATELLNRTLSFVNCGYAVC